MAITKFGLNISGLDNISAPNITIPTTGKELIAEIPRKAQELVGIAFLTHIILGGFAVLMYWILSDKSPFGEFKYSDIRAMFLASSITSVMGVVMLDIGFLNNYKSLAFYVIVTFIMYVMVLKMENKE